LISFLSLYSLIFIFLQPLSIVDIITHKSSNLRGGGRWGVQTSDQFLAVIRASHALMAAGDNEAALILLAAFASPGVDAQC